MDAERRFEAAQRAVLARGVRPEELGALLEAYEAVAERLKAARFPGATAEQREFLASRDASAHTRVRQKAATQGLAAQMRQQGTKQVHLAGGRAVLVTERPFRSLRKEHLQGCSKELAQVLFGDAHPELSRLLQDEFVEFMWARREKGPETTRLHWVPSSKAGSKRRMEE